MPTRTRPTGASTSSGLADVRERLAGLYGRAQSIEWSPFGDSGVSTVITIPFRKALAGEERATP